MEHDKNVLQFKYERTSGQEAGFLSISNKDMQNEVCELLIAGAINHIDPVKVATEVGIPQLTAATGLVYLINEGVLERGTLELQTENSQATSSAI